MVTHMSRWQDSNLRFSAPKADDLPLAYTEKTGGRRGDRTLRGVSAPPVFKNGAITVLPTFRNSFCALYTLFVVCQQLNLAERQGFEP